MKLNECWGCNKIYGSFEEFENEYPMCDTAGLVIDENGDVVFYVPCEDSYYSKCFKINYCPTCGRPVNYRALHVR